MAVSALVIYPQDFVMQAWRVLALLLFLGCLHELLGRHLRGVAAPAVSALLIGAVLSVWPAPTREPREQRVLSQVRVVERILAESDDPALGVMAYDARALCSYARSVRCLEAHPHWVRPQPPDVVGWLEAHRVRLMVLEPGLVSVLSDEWKDYLRRMAATPDHLGWRVVDRGIQYESWYRPAEDVPR
jgi:hypothetical protein